VCKIITGREEVKYTLSKGAIFLKVRVCQFLLFGSENHEIDVCLET